MERRAFGSASASWRALVGAPTSGAAEYMGPGGASGVTATLVSGLVAESASPVPSPAALSCKRLSLIHI
eukprot:7943180-Alexandrium_andersonii.AAC.1